MANYVYKCDECNTYREVSHKMEESPWIYCEDCSADMHRIPQTFQVRWREGLSPYQMEQRDPALMKALSENEVSKRRGKYWEGKKE